MYFATGETLYRGTRSCLGVVSASFAAGWVKMFKVVVLEDKIYHTKLLMNDGMCLS